MGRGGKDYFCFSFDRFNLFRFFSIETRPMWPFTLDTIEEVNRQLQEMWI